MSITAWRNSSAVIAKSLYLFDVHSNRSMTIVIGHLQDILLWIALQIVFIEGN